MINKIPILGWFLSFLGASSLSVPFWICWTNSGIGKKYFYFLPEVWQSIPFWDCVTLFIAVSVIKSVFVPKLASVTQTANHEKKDK